MERDAALALLNDQHSFPGPFTFRAVVHDGGRTAVLDAMHALGEVPGSGVDLQDVEEKVSSKGKYRSLRLRCQIDAAEDVLTVYAALHALDVVITTM